MESVLSYVIKVAKKDITFNEVPEELKAEVKRVLTLFGMGYLAKDINKSEG